MNKTVVPAIVILLALALAPSAHAFSIDSLQVDNYDSYEAALADLASAYDIGDINYIQFYSYLQELSAKENRIPYISVDSRPDLPWGTERVRTTNSMEIVPAIEFRNNVPVFTDYTFAKNIYNGTKISMRIEVFDAKRYSLTGRTNAVTDNVYYVEYAFTQFLNQTGADTGIWNFQRKEYEASFPILKWACSDPIKAKKRLHNAVKALDIYPLGKGKLGGNAVYGKLMSDSYKSAQCTASLSEEVMPKPYKFIQPRVTYSTPLGQKEFREFIDQFDNPKDDEFTSDVIKRLDVKDSWSVIIYNQNKNITADFTFYFAEIAGSSVFGVSGEHDPDAKVIIKLSEKAAYELYSDFAKEQEYPAKEVGIFRKIGATFKNMKYLFKDDITISPFTAIIHLEEMMEKLS